MEIERNVGDDLLERRIGLDFGTRSKLRTEQDHRKGRLVDRHETLEHPPIEMMELVARNPEDGLGRDGRHWRSYHEFLVLIR